MPLRNLTVIRKFGLIQFIAKSSSMYSKTCLKWPLKKKTKHWFQDQLSLNAGQKFCRMLQKSILQYFRHSLSYNMFLRPLFFSIFEWPLKTGFTVHKNLLALPTLDLFEKLVLIFLYAFIAKLKIKKLLPKVNVKNVENRVKIILLSYVSSCKWLKSTN